MVGRWYASVKSIGGSISKLTGVNVEVWTRVASTLLSIVRLHEAIDNSIGYLGFLNTLLTEPQTLLLIRLVDFTSLILLVAVVLDLFAFVFDFGEAQGCRRSFEEVAKAGKLWEILIFSVMMSISDGFREYK